MMNIIRIFTSDAKRLATNVVAMVVIMGLPVSLANRSEELKPPEQPVWQQSRDV